MFDRDNLPRQRKKRYGDGYGNTFDTAAEAEKSKWKNDVIARGEKASATIKVNSTSDKKGNKSSGKKGTFDPYKAMADRKAAAQQKKKQQDPNYHPGWTAMDYMSERVGQRLADHESGKNPFKDKRSYEKVKKMYERKLGRG